MRKFLLIVLAVVLTVFISLSGCASTITYDKGTGEQHPGHPGHEKH